MINITSINTPAYSAFERTNISRNTKSNLSGTNNSDDNVEYNDLSINKNKYSTRFGSSTESKYGYAAEFDSVSRDYANAIFNKDFSSAASMDVVTSMSNKYESLKADIENNYLGAEKDARLKELDENYKFILDVNVVQSTDLVIKNESAMNKLRSTFANAYEKAVKTKSSAFVQTAYGNMSGWKKATEDIDTQLSNFKKMFEQFQDALKDSDAEGSLEYANSILKDINAGLFGVKERLSNTGKNINESSSASVKELWDLIETKSKTTFSMDNKYGTDEEKYQAFLKDAPFSNNIDKRLNQILQDFIV